MSKAFTVYRDNCIICGHIYGIPETGVKRHAVILSHGFNGSQKETSPYAEYLAKNGFCTITYDFYGGSHKEESGGSLVDMTIETEKADLLTVIRHVRELPYVDTSELTILGCSQGGVISSLVASENPDLIQNLVLVYPALCIPDNANSGRMLFFKFDPANVPDEVKSLGMRLNGDYIRQAQKLDLIETIGKFPGRILLIYGKKDNVVPYCYAEKLIAQYEGRIESMPIEKGEHGYKKESLSTACGRILMFLKHHREILNIKVNITDVKTKFKGFTITADLYFYAEASGNYFQGHSRPGARDRQVRKGLKPVEFTADYILDGEAADSEKCSIHVINRNTGDGWIPTVSTDSRFLDFLNHTQCECVEDHWKNGLTVRIYCE